MTAGRSRWLVTGAACLLTTPACPQVALYGAQPPAGSAFVRFVNTSGAALSVAPDFAGLQNLGVAPSSRVSAYTVVDHAARRSLALDARQGGRDLHMSFHVAPDSFVTILFSAAPTDLSAVNVVDQAEFDQARARLAFYNATPTCPAASLALQPSGARVFSDLAPGASKTRSVNPVEAILQARCAGVAAQTVSLAHMEAGNSYSIWLMVPDEHPLAFVTRDTRLAYEP